MLACSQLDPGRFGSKVTMDPKTHSNTYDLDQDCAIIIKFETMIIYTITMDPKTHLNTIFELDLEMSLSRF